MEAALAKHSEEPGTRSRQASKATSAPWSSFRPRRSELLLKNGRVRHILKTIDRQHGEVSGPGKLEAPCGTRRKRVDQTTVSEILLLEYGREILSSDDVELA